jgi:hypothetical protein
MKRIKLELCAWAIPNNDGVTYEVTRVTNSVSWTPGEYLDKQEVHQLIRNLNSKLDVVITKPKGKAREQS